MSVYCKLQNEILTCFSTLKGSKEIRQASNAYIPNALLHQTYKMFGFRLMFIRE